VLVVWQVAVVKKKLESFKFPAAVDAIRVLKKWRNGVEWQGEKKPSSYLLELVVLAVCKAAKTGSKSEWHPPLRSLLLAAFELLLKMAQRPRKRVLLDVACPANNVAGSVRDRVWGILERECGAEVARARAAYPV
jgi:hypothetical protein